MFLSCVEPSSVFFSGLADRLQSELSKQTDPHEKVNVVPSGGENAAWRGAAMLGRMFSFHEMCVS